MGAPVILDGHEVENCLAHLAEIEAAFPELVAPPTGESTFRVAGRWLVEEGHLRERLRSAAARIARSQPRTPFLGDLKTGPLLRAALTGPRISAHTSAVAICFKQNIRAFYLTPGPVTLKMANPAVGGRGLRQEIAMRQRIGDTAGVMLPRLIASERAGPRSFLWEELVIGRHLDSRRDRAFFLDHVLSRLVAFYASSGLRQAVAADVLDVERVIADVLALADGTRWSRRWVSPARFREQAIRCRELANRSLLIANGHGDLSNGNILITEDQRVCLVDWGRSRELIVMQDLLKLFREYPGSWSIAVEGLESLCPADGDPQRLPWSDQALLGTLQLIQYFGAMYERVARRRDELGARYVRQCQRVLAKEFAAASRLIESGRL